MMLRTRATVCRRRLWSFFSSDVFLTSSDLSGWKPVCKDRKSSYADFHPGDVSDIVLMYNETKCHHYVIFSGLFC